MIESAFLIVPGGEEDVLSPTGSMGELSPSGDASGGLDTQLRARLPGYEIEYMSGIGGWTVRVARPVDIKQLRHILDGLSVKVADETSFSTF